MKKISKENIINIIILDLKLTWFLGVIPFIFIMIIWKGGSGHSSPVIFAFPMFIMLCLHSIINGLITAFWVHQRIISSNRKLWLFIILCHLYTYGFILLLDGKSIEHIVEKITLLVNRKNLQYGRIIAIEIKSYIVAILVMILQIYLYRKNIVKILYNKK